MFLSKLSGALPLCIVAAARLVGQQGPTFKTEAGLVRLDLQVEEQGRALTGLRGQDFLVYDEGEPQTPLYFDVVAEPLDLVLLLDTSASMEHRTELVAESGRQALNLLGPGDRLAVLTFAEKPRLLVPLSADRHVVLKALRRACRRAPRDGTDLYAGIDRATRILHGQDGQRRRAMLVVTDNLGALRRNENQTLMALARTGAAVNALIFDPGIDTRQHSSHAQLEQDVTRIADFTGGVSVKAAETHNALPDALALIRTRYTLYYRRPEARQGAFHQVKVALAPSLRESHPDARISVRAGYWLQ